MFYTGALLLGYLIKHLYDFRFNASFFENPDLRVKSVLSHPGNSLAYLVAAITLGIHLSHGFSSAFQSLGAHHPRWTPRIEIFGKLLAFLFAAGFAAFPIYFYFN
jgi:succinate dehydrogenase / fumarate reductase cytochrome b subunit